jgi:hypothetical protein
MVANALSAAIRVDLGLAAAFAAIFSSSIVTRFFAPFRRPPVFGNPLGRGMAMYFFLI